MRKSRMGAWCLAALVSWACQVPARAEGLVVESFTPLEETPGFQQVAIRFSEDMARLGDTQAGAPAVWRCEGVPVRPGAGRWVDTRSWVIEFRAPLPAGVRCEVRLADGLASLAGGALSSQQQRAWTVTTGGPKVDWSWPRQGAELEEKPVFLVRANTPVRQELIAQHAFCQTPTGRRAATLLGPEQARDALARIAREQYVQMAYVADRVFALSCGEMPNGERVGLVWGKEIATPQGVASRADQTVGLYTVRAPFRAEVNCRRADASGGCDPREPITVAFNADVTPEQLVRTELRDASGTLLPIGQPSSYNYGSRRGTARSVQTNRSGDAPTPPDGSVVTVTLPADLRDADGRPLANAAEFPRRVQIAVLPPYAGFPQRSGMLPWRTQAPVAWPLALRRTEKDVSVRLMRIAGDALPSSADTPLARRAEASRAAITLWQSQLGWPRQYAQPLRPYPISTPAALPWATQETRTLAADGGPMAFVPLQFAQPGLYLAEVHSDAFMQHTTAQLQTRKPGELPGPAGRATLVQVTNLDAATRIGDSGQSLVWVTALDTGLPVQGAAVDAFDCNGKLLAQGSTDAKGLLSLTLPERATLPRCADYAPMHGDSRWSQPVPVNVVVRKGPDLAVLDARAGSYAWANPSMLAHTVLDRTLFKRGETVHMQHVFRRATPTGFAAVPPGAGRIALRVGSEAVEAIPVQWDAAGNAETRWTIPASAKLGRYSATVEGPDGVTEHFQFSVEEFRAPVFDAALGMQAPWTAGGQRVAADLRLAWFAGGEAAGEPVELQGRYQFDADLPGLPPGYAFRDAALPRIGAVDMKPVRAQLDAQGLRKLTIVPPPLDRPGLLQAEMKFTDPNGEVQTVAASTSVWPTDTRLGVRMQRSPAGAVSAQALILGPDGQPVAGRLATLSVQALRDSFDVQPTGEEQVLCQRPSDARGELECPLLQLPTTTGRSRWLFRVRSTDSGGKPVTSSVVVHDYQLRWGSVEMVAPETGEAPVPAGQPVRVRLTAPFTPATVLLTLEREGVLEASVQRMENTTATFTLPLRPEWAPNVHVHARFVRGLPALPAEPQAAQEVARSATATVPIAPTRFALSVRVAPRAQKVEPRTPLVVDVSASHARDGTPAAGARVTVAVVDEALLALLPNGTWDLLEAMMRTRPLRVEGASLETLLRAPLRMGARAGFWPDDERAAAYGPAPVAPAAAMARHMGEEPAAARSRRDFGSLALWKTDTVLDAQGRAQVTVPFKDSLTRWRIVAIVQAGSDAFGTGEAAVHVSQDVQLFSGLPLVVRSGDRLLQWVTLRNGGSAALDLQVRAQATAAGGGKPLVLPARQVHVAPGGSARVAWSVPVPTGLAAWRWRVEAFDRAGRSVDTVEVEQRVEPELPVTVRQATLQQVAGPVRLPVQRPGRALPGLGGLRVTLQDSLVAGALGEAQRWMDAYPYTCMEQLASRAVAAGAREQWDWLMGELPRYMDGEGLVRYFSEASLPGSEMLTSYLLDIAKAQGWEVPQEQRERMLAALQGIVDKRRQPADWMPEDSAGSARLLSLQATLAEHGKLRAGPLPVTPGDPGALPAVALIDWARALLAQAPAAPGPDLRRAAALLRSRYDLQGTRMNWRNEGLENWWWFMWNGDLAAARAVHVLQRWQAVDASWRADLPRIVNGFVGRQQAGRWSTTTANAWAAVAMRSFAATVEQGPVSGRTEAAIAQRPGVRQSGTWPSPAPLLLAWPQDGAAETLLLRHEGGGAPWAQVAVLAAERLAQPLQAGMRVHKTVQAVERKHRDRWSAGDVVRVRLAMHSQADLTWVVVRDPVPSGATILGRGLARESGLAQQGQAGASGAWLAHVERAADSYRAYYRWVPRGDWSVEYTMRINNPGRFRLPPTRVEAMYAPEIFGEAPNAEWAVTP